VEETGVCEELQVSDKLNHKAVLSTPCHGWESNLRIIGGRYIHDWISKCKLCHHMIAAMTNLKSSYPYKLNHKVLLSTPCNVWVSNLRI